MAPGSQTYNIKYKQLVSCPILYRLVDYNFVNNGRGCQENIRRSSLFLKKYGFKFLCPWHMNPSLCLVFIIFCNILNILVVTVNNKDCILLFLVYLFVLIFYKDNPFVPLSIFNMNLLCFINIRCISFYFCKYSHTCQDFL